MPLLDKWLRESALNADRAGTARTVVWSEDNHVVVYFSLAPHEVRRDTLPRRLGRGGPDAVPAILLARLALDSRLHGQGLGQQLLVDALLRAVSAVVAAGGRLLVVDAIDQRAASFYEHHGFRWLPGGTLRLAMKASDAARSLGLEWR